MNPVRVAESNIVYKGPSADIGDLWCHRIRVGVIRTTWEPNEEERELLANGGRIQLTILHEPIPPVMLSVISAEESAPISEHGWKIDAEPGDDLGDREEGRSGKNSEGFSAEQESSSKNSSPPQGSPPEARAS